MHQLVLWWQPRKINFQVVHWGRTTGCYPSFPECYPLDDVSGSYTKRIQPLQADEEGEAEAVVLEPSAEPGSREEDPEEFPERQPDYPEEDEVETPEADKRVLGYEISDLGLPRNIPSTQRSSTSFMDSVYQLQRCNIIVIERMGARSISSPLRIQFTAIFEIETF